MARQLVVMDFDRAGLHAVEVSVRRGGVRLLGSASAARPAGVSADDPEATGAWIRDVLDAARIRTRRMLVALPRDAAAVKRLQLPAVDADELPGMVGLAMQREMTFDAADAVIDFLPPAAPSARAAPAAGDQGDEGAALAAAGRSTILAAALPSTRLEAVRATVSAAGRTLDGVTLRSLGLAGLLARLAADAAGGVDAAEAAATADAAAAAGATGEQPTAPAVRSTAGRELVLDVGDRGLELVVLEDGGVRFARAIALPPAGGDPADRVRAILTEARRTWMSYRVAEDGDVSRAAVLGAPGVAEPVAEELHALLGVPVRRLDPRAAADADPGVADRVLESGGWPLVGLVLPEAEPRLDWTAPREAPDHRRIAVRRLGLVAALLGIVAAGAWTHARQELAGLRQELADVQERRREVAGDYARLQRDIARRLHLERWSAVDPAWIEHLAAIDSFMPPPGEVVLDGVSGSLAWRGVDYDRREREWSAPFELTFSIEGETASRTAAESIRGALVDADVYRVSSSGGDGRAGRRLPVGFAWRLGTRAVAPPAAAETVADAGDAARGGSANDGPNDAPDDDREATR